jgi:hypothetical protein
MITPGLDFRLNKWNTMRGKRGTGWISLRRPARGSVLKLALHRKPELGYVCREIQNPVGGVCRGVLRFFYKRH